MAKRKKKPDSEHHLMTDIFADEVSLVDEPANRRRFTVIKQKGSAMNDEVIELLEELCDEEGLPDAIAKAIKKADIPSKAVKALKNTVNILKKYQADFPDDVQKALGILARLAGAGYAKPSETQKAMIPKSVRLALEEILHAVKRLSKTQKTLKAMLAKGKISTKKKSSKSTSDDDDDEMIVMSQKELDQVIDQTALQVLKKAGYSKDEVSEILEEDEDDDDVFSASKSKGNNDDDDEDEDEEGEEDEGDEEDEEDEE